MRQNNTLKEMAKKLMEAESIILVPHIQPDGDTLGSSAALCRALRNAGKTAWVLMEDPIAGNLQFLDNGYCTTDFNCISQPDICICVDCGEVSRFPKRREKFFQAKVTMCIDHHSTSEPFADYNYIDSKVAATAELVYQLLKETGLKIDKEIGEAIFTGICTDTGNFQYSNATKQSHLITAELYDAGIDHTKIAIEIYQNTRLEKIVITNRILDTLMIFAEGKVAMAYVSQHMLEEVGADIDETDGVVESLRNIKGVEIAAFVKEKAENLIRVSMRAKTSGNVARIASAFQGGGHVKAAGCTIEAPLLEATAMLKMEIEKSLEK